jgi:8-oxo-dGTP pyrophosphatase MutT (NUDIX family)
MGTPDDRKRKPTSPAGPSTRPEKRQETQPRSPQDLAQSRPEKSQVYAAVRDPNTGAFIVGKKNVYWGKKRLNAFGQYCLPGGGLESEEKLADGAIREFREETGIDLKGEEYNERLAEPKAYVISDDPKCKAHLVVLDVAFNELHSIDQLSTTIRGNLQQVKQKKRRDIHPELAEVLVRSPEDATGLLGVWQEVKDPRTQKVIYPQVDRDSIDWYAKMGTKMQELKNQRPEGGSRMGEADSAAQSTSTQSTSTQVDQVLAADEDEV